MLIPNKLLVALFRRRYL